MLDIAAHFRLNADPFAPSGADAPARAELLAQSEAIAFIDERLARAGARRDLFSRAAKVDLWQVSGALPHRLRWLAGLAMVEAMLSGDPTIEVRHVHAAASRAAFGHGPPPPPRPTPAKARRRFALPIPSTGQAAAILALPIVLLTAPIVADLFTVPKIAPTRSAIEPAPQPAAQAAARSAPAPAGPDAANTDPGALDDAMTPAGAAAAPQEPWEEQAELAIGESAEAELARAEPPAPPAPADRPLREVARGAGRGSDAAVPDGRIAAGPGGRDPRPEAAPTTPPRNYPAPPRQPRDFALPPPPAPLEPEGALAVRLAEADPDAPVRVFIHHAPGDRGTAAALGAALAARGWPIAELRPVDVEVRRLATRYFFREDADPAFALAEDLSDLTGKRARARDMRSYERPPRVGTIEVWLPSRG